MGENFKGKFSAFSERLKVGGTEVGRKMSERIITASGKMKELFQVSTQADKLVEEATAENMEGPDWGKSLELCDFVNTGKVSGQEAVRAIKKRMLVKSTHIQYLALTLLETCVKNCEKMFSEVASEKVLDEMVKIIDDPQTPTENRDKALKLIEAWGESTEELGYLPIFEQTYKSLKSRGIQFPGRDLESLAPIFTPPQSISRSGTEGSGAGMGAESGGLAPTNPEDAKEIFDVSRNSVELLSTVLTSSPQQEALQEELTLTLVEQCRQSQLKVQKIIERGGDNDPLLFEALHVNDELQQVLAKYEEMCKLSTEAPHPEEPVFAHVQAEEDDSNLGTSEESKLVRNRTPRTTAPSATSHDDEAMLDLDAMIFGESSTEETSQKYKNRNTDDLIKF
ncbi:unnamed protein product [Sphagnum jensenii]|uniref:Target of Myb protein 1 n=1 Tax=Sphagnum jensenii TaxID=128206 RepID=A0ABP1BX70_9BRYO